MQIAIIGFGEAGSALVRGWGAPLAGGIVVYDKKLDAPQTAAEITKRAARLGVATAPSSAEAVAGADLVLCTVTADQAVLAAQAAAPNLGPGAFWCDLNSCAPSSKRRAAEVIEAGGGRYVDVAVMAPVHPKLNMVPLLISGPHAEAIGPLLQSLPMSLRVVDGAVGAASSIKMIRSVMVKGLEALTAECVLAAVAAGVEDEVLPSLLSGHPKLDVAERAAYNFERSLQHGERRAAEMEEVAITLEDLGLPARIARATVDWQRQIAGAGIEVPGLADEAGFRDYAERLLPKIKGA